MALPDTSPDPYPERRADAERPGLLERIGRVAQGRLQAVLAGLLLALGGAVVLLVVVSLGRDREWIEIVELVNSIVGAWSNLLIAVAFLLALMHVWKRAERTFERAREELQVQLEDWRAEVARHLEKSELVLEALGRLRDSIETGAGRLAEGLRAYRESVAPLLARLESVRADLAASVPPEVRQLADQGKTWTALDRFDPERIAATLAETTGGDREALLLWVRTVGDRVDAVAGDLTSTIDTLTERLAATGLSPDAVTALRTRLEGLGDAARMAVLRGLTTGSASAVQDYLAERGRAWLSEVGTRAASAALPGG